MNRDSAVRAILWPLVFGLWTSTAIAQSDVAFPTQVYVGRRAALLNQLPEAVVVIPGRYLVSPGDDPVKQDPDFWYLTGVESPYAILVLEQVPASSTSLRRWRSLLFLPTEFQFAGGQFPMADSMFRRAPWNRPKLRLVSPATTPTGPRVSGSSGRTRDHR